MKLLVPKINPNNKSEANREKIIGNVNFEKYKFSKREFPENKDDIVIVCCFSEFGCEIVGTMYCIPILRERYPDKYFIAVGWFGREYLYRHLVDEFWEINEEHMWLREYARAFHNESKNLKQIEKSLMQNGKVIASDYLGKMVVSYVCNSCKGCFGNISFVDKCEKCSSPDLMQSIFADVKNYKKNVTRIPSPSDDKLNYIKKYLGKNPVGVFARNRACYGRNLSVDFYVKLLNQLENKGYTPIWLGEKQSTLPCPLPHIVDFSRMEESRDLELTLAIIKQLKFTIQFWTASSRLAAIMETPYILFESPDQIYGNGQEGYRLNLTSFGPKKLVISHYLNVSNDHETALNLVEQAIDEMNIGNYEEIFGLLESEIVARSQRDGNTVKIGG